MGRSFFFQKIGHIMEILRSLLGFSLSSFCISFISLAALSKQLIWDGYRKLTTGERDSPAPFCLHFLSVPSEHLWQGKYRQVYSTVYSSFLPCGLQVKGPSVVPAGASWYRWLAYPAIVQRTSICWWLKSRNMS